MWWHPSPPAMQRQHAATTCPSRVAVLVVANPNKAFLDGPFGLPFLQCPWAFSVTASRMRMSQNHAWEAHRILPDSAISSRPVQKTITVTQISVTHNICPPTPQANRRQASPKLIPPRRDKQPSLQTSRSPRGIKEPEPTSTSPPKKSLDPTNHAMSPQDFVSTLPRRASQLVSLP